MRRVSVDGHAPDAADWSTVTRWLRDGHVVIFPTDTFYGLAVDPTNPDALAALFALKGRPASAALPFVAASRAQVDAWCGPLSGASARLADGFWPGPLSIVVEAPTQVAPPALGGAGSLAIRVPDHPIARALALAWGTPLPATSANPTGAPPARAVEDLAALGEAADVLVIDAGRAPGGAPSTIVDARGPVPRLVRDGAIAWKRVLDFLEG
jgi:L-threonylcarbamoyladenylate synthase